MAAAVGANSAAGDQLASGEPIMAIGGFNGTDPAPTLAQFKGYVAAGKIHYFLGGGGGGLRPAAAARTIALGGRHLHRATVGGITVYDLTYRTS